MGKPANHPTVLVVEDEVLIRMSAVATLEEAGFQVLEAQDGAEALEILAARNDVSILLTDVRLPGSLDGLALVTQVCAAHPGIRAIIVSGNTSADDAIRAGALSFLHKPYMPHAMVQAVRDILLHPGCGTGR